MPETLLTVYTDSFCGHCMRVLDLLQRRGIEYMEFSVEDNPALRDELVAKNGRRSLPQVYLGERFVGGADELAAMDRSGELDSLMANGA